MALGDYEFQVDGRIPEHARDAFTGMRMREIPAGLVLRGAVLDESHLLGILSQLRLLGLRIVFAHPAGSGISRAPFPRNPTARGPAGASSGTS
jgi:hypothetical protein